MFLFKNNRKAIYVLLSITAILAVCFSIYYKNAWYKDSSTIPETKNLNVPFSSQAPKEQWEEPWLNACEETSIIMADNFYRDKKINPEEARAQILKILSIKEKEFGKSQDESMERIAEIVNLAELSWKAHVSTNPLLNDIKKEIAEGRPIIAPVDVRVLMNSPYEGTEIDYHVLIISGYDEKTEEFIVQDPGTKTGKNDRYGYQNFYDAINDYLPNSFPSGRKAVLFTSLN